MILKLATAGLVILLSACSTTDVAGTRAGTTMQAFAGRPQPAQMPVGAAIVEAMAGGLIGGTLGSGLDQRDRRRALEAEYRALEYTPAGQPVSWGAADSRGGEVVAGSPYRVGSQDCRQYIHTVHAGERSQTARGSACRNPDGSWTPLA